MAIVKKPSLVPDWRDCWRWFSMQAGALSTAILGAWLAVPDDMRAQVPTPYIVALVFVLVILGMFGRLIDQPKASPPEPPQ